MRQADGSWVNQPVAGIAVGALLRVKPGERVPMDGAVRTGQTSINRAPVTGESIPVDKAPETRSSLARSTKVRVLSSSR